MISRPRAATLCALLAVAPVAAACTSGGPPTARSAGSVSSSSGFTATRWWSNSAVTEGSTIDQSAPQAAASRLHVSKTDYCGMLRQTVTAGKSILPGVTASDPALLASTKAFVAEIEKVAPHSVSSSWHVLGAAVLALVASGGDPAKVKGIDATAVQSAGSAISADAKHSCGVDLSAPAP